MPRFAFVAGLDDMPAERDKLNNDIQTILDRRADAWGIKVANVEIKHVDRNENMIRAIARQAARELVEAAKILSAEPNAIQLRYLRTLMEIAGDKSSTIVFPLDLIEKLRN